MTAAVLAALFLPKADAHEALMLWADRAHIVDQLAKIFAEAPRALGITDDGAVLELFTAGDGETWTILETLPNGMSRIVATGQNWMARTPTDMDPKT